MEIAALASSQHRCQGFGRMGSRGTEKEYVELLKGSMPQVGNDIFQGINTTWSRVEGGENIGKILYAIEKNFDFINNAIYNNLFWYWNFAAYNWC